MNTTLTIDLGMIAAALAPTIAIVVTWWLQQRKLRDVHELVNSNYLASRRALLVSLELRRDSPGGGTADLNAQIESLRDEIGRADAKIGEAKP